MLEHICYKKYLDFKPHPLQKQFHEIKSGKRLYMAGGSRRIPQRYVNTFELWHKIAKLNKEDIDNGGSPCA